MKTLFSIVFLALILKGQGSLVKPSEKEITQFKNEMKKELVQLTQPLLQAADGLRTDVAHYKAKHAQAELCSDRLFDIDTEACQKLSDTLEVAGQLGWNATMDVYEMLLNVTSTLGDLTGCIGWDPIKTAKCYVNSITTIINDVKAIKPTIVESLEKIWSMRSQLEPEFLDCIGNGPTTEPPTTQTTTVETTTPTTTVTTTKKPCPWWNPSCW